MMVVSVAPGGPAAQAGLKPGDFVTSINGKPVHGMRDIVQILERVSVGQQVRLGIVRGNQTMLVAVRLQDSPPQKAAVS